MPPEAQDALRGGWCLGARAGARGSPASGCPDTTLTEAGKHSAHSEIVFVKCNNKKNERQNSWFEFR